MITPKTSSLFFFLPIEEDKCNDDGVQKEEKKTQLN